MAELVLRVLKNPSPSASRVNRRRAEAKAAHWVQQVRRGNLANIGDYPTPKEERAPIVPAELKVAEKWHVPFALESFQAVRGAYGVQVHCKRRRCCRRHRSTATAPPRSPPWPSSSLL